MFKFTKHIKRAAEKLAEENRSATINISKYARHFKYFPFYPFKLEEAFDEFVYGDAEEKFSSIKANNMFLCSEKGRAWLEFSYAGSMKTDDLVLEIAHAD